MSEPWVGCCSDYCTECNELRACTCSRICESCYIEIQSLPSQISQLIEESHETAKQKGWWENWERPFGEQMSNFHAELSEVWEEYRKHGMSKALFIYESPSGKPEGVAVELADLFIRVFDTCGRYNIPLEDALEKKMEYNKTRPHRHGGKLA